MPRTTAAAVEGILEVDPQVDLDPFIETANSLVTEHCDYDDTRMELIERWLSAHFYQIMNPQAVVDQVGSTGGTVRQQYESKVDLGFNVTRYGQQAMLLDTDGGLATLNSQTVNGRARRIQIKYLGRPESEMSAYEE
jgi:hypothetical protein